jgi:hypothetical protein
LVDGGAEGGSRRLLTTPSFHQRTGHVMAQKNRKSLVKVLDRTRADLRRELIAYFESLIDRHFTGSTMLECEGDEMRIYETPRGRNRIDSIRRWPQATSEDVAVDSHSSEITVQDIVDELKQRWLGSE